VQVWRGMRLVMFLVDDLRGAEQVMRDASL
jgi:hypothetical protein